MSDSYAVAIPCCLACLFMGVVTGYAIGGAGHFAQGREEMQAECVLAGHAEYVPDEKGRPQFRFLDPCKEEKVDDHME